MSKAAVVTAMDVFEAFPNAIVSGVYQIGSYQRGSVVGAVWDADNAVDLDVIVEEGDKSSINTAPNAEPLDADLLLYARPEQLPTTNPRALAAGYLIYDSVNDDYFAIIDASIGKNQDNGTIEHIELLLQQTEVA